MTLLLLAGTGEAQQVARLLVAEGRPAIASLAGATRAPRAMGLPTRIGGFGGEDGFLRYLTEAGITAVLDATHPFASRISERTARLCADRAVPYCQLLRPEWVPGAGDRWTIIAAEEEAAAHIPEGATVFLATGRQGVTRFANLDGRRLICRVVDPPEAPFPMANGTYLVGRPPFSVAEEIALFTRLGIDWLVVKNAGGAASESKLAAARALNLPVAMIARPPQPKAPRVATVAAAMEWVRNI
ncbi:precorrin-6x reductase [Roseovarius sp. TM1035]|jgi:precorrin-6A/cobalt-precorrin-6A reductase|uniref:cobalt-precorrin-6A reductase n=1 Tax=Roseovarius sp. TM1035 TaxID=391613 RepID=UPI0001557148|nr:cobalt-precorrin-6A reductase [Roseovarius sp. TM1035]AWZ22390.1 Cobalt-precorrin-6x reductase [Roseovarius sp. AK1035]EDM30672.1 precorrin-6x reductase [Roseovarius sp. TM1035]